MFCRISEVLVIFCFRRPGLNNTTLGSNLCRVSKYIMAGGLLLGACGSRKIHTPSDIGGRLIVRRIA